METFPLRPRLFYSHNYPPVTPEEKLMWEWRTTMMELDPRFQWKMPIEFYGRAVDQYGDPVAGARAVMAWTTAVGPVPDPERVAITDDRGFFELRDVQGKRLSVGVSKAGYAQTRESFGSFEYADFTLNLFHVPDQARPIVFRLQKYDRDAEPMYRFHCHTNISLDGTAVVLDASAGSFAWNGDVAVSVTLGEGRARWGPAYTVMLESVGDPGLAPSDEEFLWDAPDQGWQKRIVETQEATDTGYRNVRKFRFYLKTLELRYAVVELEVTVHEKSGKATVSASIDYNPSGSRKVQYDPAKAINR